MSLVGYLSKAETFSKRVLTYLDGLRSSQITFVRRWVIAKFKHHITGHLTRNQLVLVMCLGPSQLTSSNKTCGRSPLLSSMKRKWIYKFML